MNRPTYADPAPTWEPPPGHQHFLPELDYFWVTSDGPAVRATPSFDHAVRVTAEAIARLADRYSARSLLAAAHRDGDLQASGDIDEVINWLMQFGPLHLAGLSLYRGQQVLLDQDDGIPGTMSVQPDEFVQVQEAWKQHGLPADLYYPAHSQITVVEPVDVGGRLVRRRQHYTPRRWAKRPHERIASLQVPTDAERRQYFLADCDQFVQVLTLRLMELTEPGQDPEAPEVGQVSRLLGEVMTLSRTVRGTGDQPLVPSHS